MSARDRPLYFHEYDRHIEVSGDIAVVTYRYESVWQDDGGDALDHSGHDMVALARDHQGWRLAWRERVLGGE